AEALPAGPVLRVPQAGRIIGVHNVRGRIVPIADLGTLVNLRSARPTDERSVVVFTQADDTLGLLVDSAELATLPRDADLHPPPDDLREHTCVVGLRTDGAIVLDAARILHLPDLHPSASSPTTNQQGTHHHG